MKTKSPNKSPKVTRKPKSPGSTGSREAPSGRSPSVKERKYVAARLGGKGPKRAALDAGYSAATAKNATQRVERKPNVRKLLLEAFRKAGITPSTLAKVAWQGLNATVVHHRTKESRREVHVDFKERREMLKLIGQFEGSLIEKVEVDGHVTYEELLDGTHE